jgi:hypothetical protein
MPATAAHAVFKGGVAELVIGRAFVGVLEDLIGLGDFLELGLGFRVVGIAVGVELHGELAIGALERLLVRPTIDAEHLVIIAFGHGGSILHR